MRTHRMGQFYSHVGPVRPGPTIPTFLPGPTFARLSEDRW